MSSDWFRDLFINEAKAALTGGGHGGGSGPVMLNGELFHEWDGTVLKITSSSGTSSMDLQGPKGSTGSQGPKGDKGDKGDTGAQGEKGDTGAAGKDGTSVTHKWNGTTLSVTSASGTTSANLKGEKGDTGDTGPQGPQGDQGPKGDTGEQGPKGDTGDSTTISKTATLSTNWTGSTAPYKQTISVSGVLSTDRPHVTPIYSADNATATMQEEEWGKISDIESGSDTITFECFSEKPSIAFDIQIEINR